MADAAANDSSPIAFASSDDEAKQRAEKCYRDDPFGDVRPSLLSSADIARYVGKTGMLHPFDPKKLKTASYEVRPRGEFIYWEKSRWGTRKVASNVDSKTRRLNLPRNSISYLQVEPYFRLPLYIAMRFNLRIKHVHRGLLLGTGPLIDPGFAGQLLIPIHNLTATDYEINLDEKDNEDGLIWIEFTKTTFDKQRDTATDFEAGKKNRSADYYLQKANGNNPILSSIHDAIEEAKRQAASAANWVKWISGIGILAIVSVIIAFFSLISNSVGLATAVSTNLSTVSSDVAVAKARLDSAEPRISDANAMAAQIKALQDRVDAMERDLARTRPNVVPPVRPNAVPPPR